MRKPVIRYGGPPGFGMFTSAMAKPQLAVRTSRTLSASSIASGSFRHFACCSTPQMVGDARPIVAYADWDRIRSLSHVTLTRCTPGTCSCKSKDGAEAGVIISCEKL
jgi:hypothetical protein